MAKEVICKTCNDVGSYMHDAGGCYGSEWTRCRDCEGAQRQHLSGLHQQVTTLLEEQNGLLRRKCEDQEKLIAALKKKVSSLEASAHTVPKTEAAPEPTPTAAEAAAEESKTMAREITTTDELESLIGGSLPVLVDVYAKWCKPCKNLAPIIDQVSEAVAGRAEVVKVDLDQFTTFAEDHGIQSVPTLLVFKNGVVAARDSGLQPKNKVLALLGLGE
jgi:thioredoxin 1